MSDPKLEYTAYHGRTQWYMSHWGTPAFVHKALMEDDETKLGVMAFAPNDQRGWWTFATNGMAERRMPCIEQPHGNPSHRLELIAYSRAPADWICSLLVELARYPFQHGCGLAIGHTLPVATPGQLWSGYLLLMPKFEPEQFNPLAIDVGIGGDWIFFAEVMGLKADELQRAIDCGGPQFAADCASARAEDHWIDTERVSLLIRP